MVLALGAGSLLAQTNAIQKAHDDYCYHHDDEPICSGKGMRPLEINPTVIYRPASPIFKPQSKPPEVQATPAPKGPAMAPVSVRPGEVDWRFLQPRGTLTAGLNYAAIQRSAVGREVLARLMPDSQQILDRSADIEQIGISRSGTVTVVMLAGKFADATLPELPLGLKAIRVSDSLLLLGDSKQGP